MAKVDTVYIHNDELHAEAEVPEHTVAGYAGQGWTEGPLPEKQAERDKARDELVAQSRANAERTAADQEATEAAEAGAQVLSPAAEPVVPIAVDTTSITPVATRPRGGSENPTNGANTDNPKEG